MSEQICRKQPKVHKKQNRGEFSKKWKHKRDRLPMIGELLQTLHVTPTCFATPVILPAFILAASSFLKRVAMGGNKRGTLASAGNGRRTWMKQCDRSCLPTSWLFFSHAPHRL